MRQTAFCNAVFYIVKGTFPDDDDDDGDDDDDDDDDDGLYRNMSLCGLIV